MIIEIELAQSSPPIGDNFPRGIPATVNPLKHRAIRTFKYHHYWAYLASIGSVYYLLTILSIIVMLGFENQMFSYINLVWYFLMSIYHTWRCYPRENSYSVKDQLRYRSLDKFISLSSVIFNCLVFYSLKFIESISPNCTLIGCSKPVTVCIAVLSIIQILAGIAGTIMLFTNLSLSKDYIRTMRNKFFSEITTGMSSPTHQRINDDLSETHDIKEINKMLSLNYYSRLMEVIVCMASTELSTSLFLFFGVGYSPFTLLLCLWSSLKLLIYLTSIFDRKKQVIGNNKILRFSHMASFFLSGIVLILQVYTLEYLQLTRVCLTCRDILFYVESTLIVIIMGMSIVSIPILYNLIWSGDQYRYLISEKIEITKSRNNQNIILTTTIDIDIPEELKDINSAISSSLYRPMIECNLFLSIVHIIAVLILIINLGPLLFPMVSIFWACLKTIFWAYSFFVKRSDKLQQLKGLIYLCRFMWMLSLPVFCVLIVSANQFQYQEELSFIEGVGLILSTSLLTIDLASFFLGYFTTQRYYHLIRQKFYLRSLNQTDAIPIQEVQIFSL